MTSQQDAQREVDLCEYEQLRNEINNRTQMSTGLVGLQLAALGAGLSVLDKHADVVIALAAVSAFLWLLWIDHTSQVYKIAAYIGLQLAPRLSGLGQGVLGWERFMRILDKGGRHAGDLLFPGASQSQVPVLRAASIGWFISLLFGLSPPLMLALFAIANKIDVLDLGTLSVQRLMLLLALVAWLYALRQYLVFIRMRRKIDESLLAAETAPDPTPTPQQAAS